MPSTPNAFVEVLMEGDDKQVMRMLERLNTTLQPASIGSWLGMKVDPWIRQRARERFQKEGDDVSGPWAPLKASTQRMRVQQGYGPSHPINRRTGELENYITGGPNRISISTIGATLTTPGRPPSGELKTKVETAQHGKVMPSTVARPVMGVNEKDLLAVLTELSLFISVGQLI